MTNFKIGDLIYGAHTRKNYFTNAEKFYFAIVTSVSQNGETIQVITLFSTRTKPFNFDDVHPENQRRKAILQRFFSNPTERTGHEAYNIFEDARGFKFHMDSANAKKVLSIPSALEHMAELSGKKIPSNFQLFYDYSPINTFQKAMPPTSL